MDLFFAEQQRVDFENNDDQDVEYQTDTVECRDIVDLDLLLIIFELVHKLHEDLDDEDRFGYDCVSWIL